MTSVLKGHEDFIVSHTRKEIIMYLFVYIFVKKDT